MTDNVFNQSVFYQSSSMTPSKVHYSNTRQQFRMKSTFLPLRVSLHLRKISKCNRKKHIFPLDVAVNLSILYQNSGLTKSKFYYSNTRHQVCMN